MLQKRACTVCLFLQMFLLLVTLHLSEAVSVKVRCDDSAVIYVDGHVVGHTSHWLGIWSHDVKDDAATIAISCQNYGGPGGLIASFSNGVTTDYKWKCSDTRVRGWYDKDFDDSDWDSAHVIQANNGSDQTFPKDDNFPDNAQWIWESSNDQSSGSYCRRNIRTIDVKMRCEDHATVYVDGREMSNSSDSKGIWTGEISADVSTIAIYCQNIIGFGGMIASFSNGFTTDGGWKCSATNVHGWYDKDFNDSGWNGAYVIQTNDGNDQKFSKDDNFPENAKWIWTNNNIYSSDSYCRGKLKVNECKNQNGGCSHTCVDLPLKYSCTCEGGYQLQTDQHTCLDIDECKRQTHDCVNAICKNTPGSFQCYCNKGYQPVPDGSRCTDINECETGQHDCSADCVNVVGTYACHCDNKTVKLGSDCQARINAADAVESNGTTVTAVVLAVALFLVVVGISIYFIVKRVRERRAKLDCARAYLTSACMGVLKEPDSSRSVLCKDVNVENECGHSNGPPDVQTKDSAHETLT